MGTMIGLPSEAGAIRWTPDVIDRARRLGAKRLRDGGWPMDAIGRYFGVSRQTVYNWLAAWQDDGPAEGASTG